jgi:hypothetical protein
VKQAELPLESDLKTKNETEIYETIPLCVTGRPSVVTILSTGYPQLTNNRELVAYMWLSL